MNWCEVIHCLNLNKYLARNDEISAIAAIKFYSFVAERNWLLTFKRHVVQAQFTAKTNLVRRFKQTRAKCTVHFNCAANHDFSKLISSLDWLRVLRDLCG